MKAVIIEDEIIIANVLKNKIKKIDDEIDIIEILNSKQEAVEWLHANEQPDVIFMDIQLSDGVSFEIFNEFDVKSPVIFTTAYDEYAIQAFKANGIDYLLKPIQDDELERSIIKLKALIDKKENMPDAIIKYLQSITGNASSGGNQYKEMFMVDYRSHRIPIHVKDIACFNKEAVNAIYLFNGEKYHLDVITLDEIEKLLDPKKFFRVNRQSIVQIDAIQSIKALDNAKIEVFLKKPNHGIEIDVSRLRCPDFRKWMNR